MVKALKTLVDRLACETSRFHRLGQNVVWDGLRQLHPTATAQPQSAKSTRVGRESDTSDATFFEVRGGLGAWSGEYSAKQAHTQLGYRFGHVESCERRRSVRLLRISQSLPHPQIEPLLLLGRHERRCEPPSRARIRRRGRRFLRC